MKEFENRLITFTQAAYPWIQKLSIRFKVDLRGHLRNTKFLYQAEKIVFDGGHESCSPRVDRRREGENEPSGTRKR